MNNIISNIAQEHVTKTKTALQSRSLSKDLRNSWIPEDFLAQVTPPLDVIFALRNWKYLSPRITNILMECKFHTQIEAPNMLGIGKYGPVV